ncbi:Aste57867_417 [Aphanomyces stellatus]|uniref:Aste57867_417 protein n=1 Tax=Aphanomyces stellatus TaxID=120398 RepID=A0A485K2K6_9STRA|nr:hypothetical protein As57867_000416 [Aphanomyces stellatus]VFT77642.1 Aste57867_417 [Aphanomyces stellatus]
MSLLLLHWDIILMLHEVDKKLHGSLLAAIIGWVEVIAFLAETFFVMVVAIASRSLLHTIVSFVAPHDTHTTSLPDVLFDAGFLILYLLRRSAINFHQPSTVAWAHRLGLSPQPLSRLSQGCIVYQIAGFGCFVLWQAWTREWVLSLANYYSSHGDNSLQVAHLAEILVLSPIKEELVFRGLVFHLLLNRLPTHPTAAAIVSSVLFGCTHLVNLKQSKFSTLYVLIQTGLGVEIGFFYALTYARTESLFECITLHVVNNVLSSFTSTQMELTSSPYLAPLLAHSILLYALLIIWSLHTLAKTSTC